MLSCFHIIYCEILNDSGIPKSGGAFNHMSAGLLTHIMQSGELDKLMGQTRAINEVCIYIVTSPSCHTLQAEDSLNNFK